MGGDSGGSAPPEPPSFDQEITDLTELRGINMDFIRKMSDYASKTDEYLSGIGKKVLGTMLPAMEQSFAWAKEDRENAQKYEGAQDAFLKSAMEYNTEGEQQKQRAAAAQDNASAHEAAREANQRQLQSYGVDPTQAGSQAVDLLSRVDQAKSSAALQNMATERTKETGRQLTYQAGQQAIPHLQSAQANTGLSGNLAAGASQVANQTSGAITDAYHSNLPYLSGAQGNTMGIVDTKMGDYSNQLGYTDAKNAAEADSSLGGFGDLVGTGVRAYMAYQTAGASEGADMAAGGAAGADGGHVNAPGGPTDDQGLMALSDGEYIIPANVVNQLGASQLDKFVSKSTGQAAPAPKQALPIPRGM